MSHRPLLERARSVGLFRWPSTPRGRQSVTLYGVATVLVVLMIAVAGLWFGVLEDAPGEQESPPVWLQVPLVAAALVAFASALAGGALAIMALWRGDRSALLVLPFAAAMVALTFVVGEAAVPH